MRRELFLLAAALAHLAQGQGFSLLGAGSEVGTRSGQDVGLRFYGGLGGSFDNGTLPFAVDSNGNLVRVPGVWGMEARVGAYGSRMWRHARLGLDYSGSFRHYPEREFYDSTDHGFSLSWMQQTSPRISYALHATAGTYGKAGIIQPGAANGVQGYVAGQFFDTRTNFVDAGGTFSYNLSARSSFVVGGDGFASNRRASGLSDSHGFVVTGAWNTRLSARNTVGARYSFARYDTPNMFINSVAHSFEGTFSTILGKRWSLSARAGVSVSEVISEQTVQLDPVLAALVGANAIIVGTYRKNTFPSGSISLQRPFQRAIFNVTYSRMMGGGNGLVAPARLDSGNAGLSYTALRRWNFGIDGGFYQWSDLSGSLKGTATYSAGAGVTYNLSGAIHLSSRYDARRIEIDNRGNLPRNSSRLTFGVYFSPGEIPLSLW